MCLILLAWRSHPQQKLLVAANRDEFYARPAAPAQFWHDAPHILAGRDLEQGGTWLGVTLSGRFAALTNVRNLQAPLGNLSRGLLVSDFLNSDVAPEQFLQQLQPELPNYSPFNLLLCDGKHLYYGNSTGDICELQPGVYGLSNAALDTPWPKVATGKEALLKLTANEPDTEQLFEILADKDQADETALPDTGVGITLEKQLSPRFIHFDVYGTRCSTVVTYSHAGEIHFLEKQFDETGQEADSRNYVFAVRSSGTENASK
jgi:uncharacterized protein with NRDE domain